MSRLPESCVLDASVGIKLFVDEEDSEDVRALFENWSAQSLDCVVVPDLFFIECANILWKKVQRGEYRADLALESVADLGALALPYVATFDLMERALEIACHFGVTAYDACYVALAEMKGVPLLTADSRLAVLFAGSRHEVISLNTVRGGPDA